jgi:hypothetical protein
MFVRVKRVVGLSAAIILIVAMFGSLVVENALLEYPRSPAPEVSRTVPYAVKSTVVYITEREAELLSWLSWIKIGCGVLVAFIILIDRENALKPGK